MLSTRTKPNEKLGVRRIYKVIRQKQGRVNQWHLHIGLSESTFTLARSGVGPAGGLANGIHVLSPQGLQRLSLDMDGASSTKSLTHPTPASCSISNLSGPLESGPRRPAVCSFPLFLSLCPLMTSPQQHSVVSEIRGFRSPSSAALTCSHPGRGLGPMVPICNCLWAKL